MTPPVTHADSGAYVHYPYCAVKCPYCDFNVYATPHDDAAYTDALLCELEARGRTFLPEGGAFRSLYLGGGTPSEWAPDQLARFLGAARSWLRADAEVTLEANPGTLADAHIPAFVAGGVNRFSLGAQSFLDRELELLGRTHDAADVVRTAAAARATGARLSIDLIYALPGQTEDDVARSIDRALELGVDHVSAYTLTIEPKTVFGRKARLGLFAAMEDDLQAALIEAVTSRLERAGFRRYEISSYAPAGREAVHNSIYWTGGAYLGIGAGAHSYLPGPKLSGAVRRENVRAPKAYVASTLAGATRASFEETLAPGVVLGERLMTGLRTCWGVDLAALAREAERPVEAWWAAIGPAAARLAADGLVVVEGTAIRPSARGFLFSDLIARRMLEAAAACEP